MSPGVSRSSSTHRVLDRLGLVALDRLALVVVVRLLEERPVADLDRVGASGDLDDGSRPSVGVGEVLREPFGVDRGGGDDDLEVGASRQEPLEVAQDEVDVQAALVRLVDDQGVVAIEVAVALELGEQDAVGHHLHPALLRGPVGEPHLVADGLAPARCRAPRRSARPRCGPRSGEAGCGRSCLRLAATERQADLRQLRGLPRPRLPGHDHDLVVTDRLRDVVTTCRDGQLGREVDSHSAAIVPVWGWAAKRGSGAAVSPGARGNHGLSGKASPDSHENCPTAPPEMSVGLAGGRRRSGGCRQLTVRDPGRHSRCPSPWRSRNSWRRSRKRCIPGGHLAVPLERARTPVVVVTRTGEGGTTEAAEDDRGQRDRDDRGQGPHPVGEPRLPGRRVAVRREHMGARWIGLVVGSGRRCRARSGGTSVTEPWCAGNLCLSCDLATNPVDLRQNRGPTRSQETHSGLMDSSGGRPARVVPMKNAPPDLTRPDGTPLRVLVVDDEENIAELLRMALRYEGWEVEVALTGSTGGHRRQEATTRRGRPRHDAARLRRHGGAAPAAR